MLKENITQRINNRFTELYNSIPLLIEAPGRINLIGEHTDYNDGYVLPAAIDNSIVFALDKNDKGIFRFYSVDFDSYFETSDIDCDFGKNKWVVYLLGVIAQFRKKGIELLGIDCVFGGDIPIGAGLSSSAALECGFAFGINKLFSQKFSSYELVKMSQLAEHEYAGVMCGIMDQFASMFGKKDHVLRLDCRSHDYSYFPFEMNEYIIALINTKVQHELALSEYNFRRSECEEGVKILSSYNPDIKALRDVDLSELEKFKNILNPVVYKRCYYVVSENLRVVDACEALEKSDYQRFGDLMYQSHDGLKNDYEVSCKELDILVDVTLEMDFVLGSRMMGGGFGGCTINLIESEKAAQFEKEISTNYKEKTGISPEFYFVKLSDGVRIINQ